MLFLLEKGRLIPAPTLIERAAPGLAYLRGDAGIAGESEAFPRRLRIDTSYTVKEYRSLKVEDSESDDSSSWRHTAIQLVPRNKDFRSIWINPDQVDDLRVIAECVRVLSG